MPGGLPCQVCRGSGFKDQWRDMVTGGLLLLALVVIGIAVWVLAGWALSELL